MSAARGHKPIVHFVGSIPLPDAETVFRTSGDSNRTTSKAPALKLHVLHRAQTSCRQHFPTASADGHEFGQCGRVSSCIR